MACLTPVTIRIDTPTGPLNSAVYEPVRNKIFAVRDNWIYQLNATTGAKEAESRFVYPGVPGDTYIDYDTNTDALWVTYWRSTPDGDGVIEDGKYLVEIDPDDLSLATLHAFSGGMSLGSLGFGYDSGPRQIITRAGIGWMLYQIGHEPPQSRVARINLVTPAVTHTDAIAAAASSTWGNIAHDGTNLLVGGNRIDTAEVRNPANLASTGSVDNVASRYPYGIASVAAGNNYICCGSQFIVKATNSGGAGTQIDLGRPNANPHNIRFATALNLVYIPLYKDDTVAVLDPADDSFEIKTGFTSPWDIVNTGTKAFALQHAAIGIKEIL